MRKILLVDDEEGIRIVWKKFHDVVDPVFRGQCDMDVANDLEQCLARMQGAEYDAIILDLSLKPRTSDEVISFIFENSAEFPPIIILTGDDDIFTRRRCMMAGAADFWLKSDANERPDLLFKSLYNQYLRRHYARTDT